MQAPTALAGVSNCYVFKSRLQEFAQKVGLPAPTYETIREGPPHDPTFRSTVIVSGNRYDSLDGFSNRKAAEQSAAEIALMELSRSSENKGTASLPVHQTGLCKNLLQEYAQKMNYAIPTYLCTKTNGPGRTSHFSCTVEMGGIQYIGATAGTKKEAEIKAARTAWLAIQMSGSGGGQVGGKTIYTVVPCKRKEPETGPPQGENAKPKKPKKSRIKKKPHKHMKPDPGNMDGCVNSINVENPVANENCRQDFTDVQVADNGRSPHLVGSLSEANVSTSVVELNGDPSAGGEGDTIPHVLASADACQLTKCEGEGDIVNPGLGASVVLLTDANSRNGSTNITPMISAPISSQLDGLLPDNRVDEGVKVPLLTDVNEAEAGNNGDGVGNIAPVINAPICLQLDDAVLPDKGVVDEGVEAPLLTDMNDAEAGKNDDGDGVGNIAPVMSTQTSKAADGETDTEALLPGVNSQVCEHEMGSRSEQSVKAPGDNSE